MRVDFPVRSSVFCLLDFVHLYRVLLKFMGVARNPPPLPAYAGPRSVSERIEKGYLST